MTEILFTDAEEQARDLDKLAQNSGSEGPLYGVPMTLKDQFNVAGYDTTIGYVGRALAPATEDATLVKMLKSLGAVILAKTNLPQSIMVSWVFRHRNQSPKPLMFMGISSSGARPRILFGD